MVKENRRINNVLSIARDDGEAGHSPSSETLRGRDRDHLTLLLLPLPPFVYSLTFIPSRLSLLLSLQTHPSISSLGGYLSLFFLSLFCPSHSFLCCCLELTRPKVGWRRKKPHQHFSPGTNQSLVPAVLLRYRLDSTQPSQVLDLRADCGLAHFLLPLLLPSPLAPVCLSPLPLSHACGYFQSLPTSAVRL